jgi:hypothetical protein
VKACVPLDSEGFRRVVGAESELVIRRKGTIVGLELIVLLALLIAVSRCQIVASWQRLNQRHELPRDLRPAWTCNE